MLLVCGVWDDVKRIQDKEELSGKLQKKCGFNKKMAGQNKDLQKLLKKNPFMTKESIYKFYEKKLIEYLDSEFEEYCTCDDYYEPVVEDFELTYDVEHWCKENGFEVVSCEGDGSNGRYEAKFRRGW